MNIKEYIMSFSYKEKRNRDFENYRKIREKYTNMNILQLEFEYVKLLSEYEHKRDSLGFLTIGIILTIITALWNKFFKFMQMVFGYTTINGQINNEVIMVSLIVSVTVMIGIVIFISFIIYMNITRIKKLRENLIIIQNIRNVDEI